jgi:hypothetical protein
MAPPHRRRFPGGRYSDHFSNDNGRNVKSPLAKSGDLCSSNLERAKGIEPSTYSLGSYVVSNKINGVITKLLLITLQSHQTLTDALQNAPANILMQETEAVQTSR